MKRINATMIAATGLLSFFIATESCTKLIVSEQFEYTTFNAVVESETKTILDGTSVFWEKGDKIALWYGTLDSEFAYADYVVEDVDEFDSRKATLCGFGKKSSSYLAVYPASAGVECSSKGKLTVLIPTAQEIRANSFASGSNVAIAYSTTEELSFKNVGSLLAFEVRTTGFHKIKEIRIAGTSAMSGKVQVKYDDLTSVSKVSDGINYVSMNCNEGISDIFSATGKTECFDIDCGYWEEKKQNNSLCSSKSGVKFENMNNMAYFPSGSDIYYIVALPSSHTSLSITLIDDCGRTAVARSTSPFTIERNGNTLIAKINAPSGEWTASPKVFINEIHTHNNQIELWNPNDFSVDLTGWLLVKDEKSWAFPVGSVIPAKGYKVITAGQTDCASGPMFGISGDKGFVLSLVSGTTVDKVDNSGEGHAVIGTTETYGRKTDGSSEWVTFINDGTIYESGVCDGDNSKGVIKGDEPVPVIDYTGLVINEVNGNDYNAENANDKFIELYNGSASELDLTGVVLKKDGETVWTGAKDKHVLASGAYLILYSEKSEGAKTCPAENVFSSGLSPKKAVRVQILTPGGESIDDFNYATYSGTPAPASYGRNSGSGEWYYQPATPGAVNADGTEKVTGLQ